MTLPNLIGCGAGKSGTTSLYYYLNQHPDIFMAAAKEVHFFSHHYEKGIAWYEKIFENSGPKPIIGEFSTSYMMNVDTPLRMAAAIPQTKLLFMFRNPIKRAYSNYWFSISIGTQNPKLSFSQAIRSPKGFQKYVTSGYYHEYLMRFLEFYSPKQVHIIITEDLQKDAYQQMKQCYNFLGVDDRFEPDLQKSFNTTVIASTPWQAAGYRLWLKFKNSIKPGLMWLPGTARENLAYMEHIIRDKVMRNERPPMNEEDKDYLQAIFQDHNQKLADYLGRDHLWN
ncbi:MAG: sulfotransferase [Caldilineaceae bacterium]